MDTILKSDDLPSETKGLLWFVRRLPAYLRPYRGQTLFIFFALFFDLIFDTAFRISFKFLIDDIILEENRKLLYIVLAALSFGALITSVLNVGRDLLYARVGTSVLNDIRCKVFQHLQRLSAGY